MSSHQSTASAEHFLSRSFHRLAASNLTTQLAEQMALAASSVIAVLYFAAQADTAAWLQTVQSSPFLLMSIPAGILADCLPRAKLLLGAEGLRAGFARYFVLAVIGRVEFAVAGNTRIFRRVRHGGL